MEHITIREIIDTISRGQIRIPAFQRGFVWEPDRVAYLMDSIYKEYPFGSLLFWRTKEQLRVERDLGPFQLPEPKEDYPVDYVLDGQQRITSIFATFQTEISIDSSENWKDIYFDLHANNDAQESQFVALDREQVDTSRHFPLRTLFDTTAYRRATQEFNEEIAKRVDDMQAVFKEVRIPIQVFKTEDKETVSIIFERINRQGVPLDTMQLLSAWTWSEDFQLQTQMQELADEFEPFGFKEVGTEENLLLRCCSAVLTQDASPSTLINLNGSAVRSRFEEVANGIRGAIDYIKASYNIEILDNLPFQTVIVPLSVFFAIPGNQEVLVSEDKKTAIDRWFWRACFSRRYSSGVLRNLKTDIEEIKKLKEGRPNQLGCFDLTVSPEFFKNNKFLIGSVNTKTFILLLAQKRPLSFVSGTPINLSQKLRQCNRLEFHHLMPKSFLEESGQANGRETTLANMCFLSRAENRHLGGVSPSSYINKMAGDKADILANAICPDSLFNDNFEIFIQDRAVLLTGFANTLIA